ncbi:dynamin-related protein 4C-like [Senna tora]|uniref:Dynamin-related protein 4C-like n=1 Tax=Senna tora TaxID=362788 RepID=A0A834SIN5_9FABA|nr:dynamin-related protein 4C-like [Senna tora]
MYVQKGAGENLLRTHVFSATVLPFVIMTKAYRLMAKVASVRTKKVMTKKQSSSLPSLIFSIPPIVHYSLCSVHSSLFTLFSPEMAAALEITPITVLPNGPLVQLPQPEPPSVVAPIASSYNEWIRPVLDAIENLRRLNITKEGVNLPTIVVVGDQSSGKSSVLESLAGISLPRGQGICTRVPLVMRLQNHPLPTPELVLEYNAKTVSTDEEHISDDINSATDELAGTGKGISNARLTLVVKKNGVPDLTMVDLPGITRVAVHGQPEDIYDQIKNIIMEYISPEESIILNVLSATVDFSTCESIRMSQSVDKTGKRTLAVVTKADMAPQGLLEKVTANDVNIGLGYVCVRNRIGDESYEEARMEEARLFETHPLLSKIDASILGVPVLAQKLVKLQAISISKTLPEIVKKINDRLSSCLSELDNLPKTLTSVAEAMSALMHNIGLAKESLRKILLRGEFDEYPDDKQMHCTARLVDMLNQYSNDLQTCTASNPTNTKNFLVEEIKVLEEAKCIGLPNFMPRTAFLSVLHGKVKAISGIPIGFVDKVWDYLENVVTAVMMRHSEHYDLLQKSTRRAGRSLIAKMRENSVKHVMGIVEMEKLTDYTCNPEYTTEYNRLMAQKEAFKQGQDNLWNRVRLQELGEVEIGHLRQYPALETYQAFDLKMRISAYWKIVLRRLIDSTALHLQFSINNLVSNDLEKEIVTDVLGPYGGGIEKLLEESPSVSAKRDKLTSSISVLRESKEVLANIMDQVSSIGV